VKVAETPKGRTYKIHITNVLRPEVVHSPCGSLEVALCKLPVHLTRGEIELVEYPQIRQTFIPHDLVDRMSGFEKVFETSRTSAAGAGTNAASNLDSASLTALKILLQNSRQSST
jgi:hypothetical protein